MASVQKVRIITTDPELFDKAEQGQTKDGRWYYEVEGNLEVHIIEELEEGEEI